MVRPKTSELVFEGSDTVALGDRQVRCRYTAYTPRNEKFSKNETQKYEHLVRKLKEGEKKAISVLGMDRKTYNRLVTNRKSSVQIKRLYTMTIRQACRVKDIFPGDEYRGFVDEHDEKLVHLGYHPDEQQRSEYLKYFKPEKSLRVARPILHALEERLFAALADLLFSHDCLPQSRIDLAVQKAKEQNAKCTEAMLKLALLDAVANPAAFKRVEEQAFAFHNSIHFYLTSSEYWSVLGPLYNETLDFYHFTHMPHLRGQLSGRRNNTEAIWESDLRLLAPELQAASSDYWESSPDLHNEGESRIVLPDANRMRLDHNKQIALYSQIKDAAQLNKLQAMLIAKKAKLENEIRKAGYA